MPQGGGGEAARAHASGWPGGGARPSAHAHTRPLAVAKHSSAQPPFFVEHALRPTTSNLYKTSSFEIYFIFVVFSFVIPTLFNRTKL